MLQIEKVRLKKTSNFTMENCDRPGGDKRSRRSSDCLKLLTYDPSVEDAHHLSVVPEEIWRLIFSYLEEPQDKETCFRTCTMWRDILIKERTSFLFPKILPLLTSRKFLDPDNIIHSCRGVSKMWKLSSDKHLQDIHPHSQLTTLDVNHFNTDDYHADRGEISNPDFRFSSRLEVENFMVKANTFCSDFNPFVKRSPFLVGTFTDRNQRTGAPWSIILDTFLPKFGIRIRHLRMLFTSYEEFEDSARVYSTLLSILKLVPNLHSLQLKFGIALPNDDISELQLHLPQLNSLKLVKLFAIPSPFIIQFLKGYKSVEKVKLQPSPRQSYVDVFENFKAKNLRELVFSIQNETDIQSLANSGWPLEKLHVYFELEEIYNLESIFDALSNFDKTLEKLTLFFKCPVVGQNENEESMKDLKLQLPSLKSLTVIGYTESLSPNTIDFILPMVSLQDLKVVRRDDGYITTYEEEELVDESRLEIFGTNQPPSLEVLMDYFQNHGDMRECKIEVKIPDTSEIKFYDYFEKMYESNVWEKMPSLKRISVKWRSIRETRVSGRFFYSRENLPRTG